MNVVFLNLGFGAGRCADAMEPLVFGLLSALTPPEVKRVLWDERVERLPRKIEADLVLMSVGTFQARHAYRLATQLRAAGQRVVMGGFHPTLLPEEAAPFADAVVVGDAEETWPRLLEDFRRGRLQSRYVASDLPRLQGQRIDRSLFRGKRYAPLSLLQAGRGCRYHCDFCSIHAAYGKSLRLRPVPEILEEVRGLPRSNLLFVDDNLFAERDWCRELFEGLIPLRKRWNCQISLDVSLEDDLMDLMARSGCQSVLIGFESLQEDSLRQMRKSWNLTGGDYAEAVARFRRRGIPVVGTFVFGYDSDTPDVFSNTLAFAMQNRLFMANFNPLIPTPGTPIFSRLREEGRLLHRAWWLDPSHRYGDALFHPRGMTAQELSDGCRSLRFAFHSRAAILRRALDRHANAASLRTLGLFFAANGLARREIHRKQGMVLAAEPRP